MNQVDSSYVANPQDTILEESSDDQKELEQVLRVIAHGFEGPAEMVLPRLQPFTGLFRNCQKVLDVGCGEGLMLGLLRDAGIGAVGIDIDASKVAAVHAKGLEAVTVHADEYLCDKQGEFDGIFLRHIIEHFDGPDGVRLLYLCRKALRPGGVIVIVTPNYMISEVAFQMFWLDVTHRRPYPLALLHHIFTALGIAVTGYEVKEMGLDLVIAGRVPK